MGSPEFAVPSLEALVENRWEIVAVVTQPDKATGRGQRVKSSPIKPRAVGLGLKVLEPERIKNNPEFLETLKKLEPDLIIVVAYGKILPQELLDLPVFGALNLHGSFLPRHRGASPIQGAILAGDQETGITLMKMVPQVDAGPILAQSQPVPIEADDTAGTLSQKLASLGAQFLIDNLPGFFAGTLPQTPQDEKSATYTKIIKKEEARIDWRKPAEHLAREIRAYHPWPVAWTLQNGRVIKIHRARVQKGLGLQSGQVAQKENRLLIGTGQEALEILELQLEGKKRLAAQDFLRGQKDFLGLTLN